MARIRIFIVLVLALAAGGVLAFGTYNYVAESRRSRPPSMPTKPVVVAAADLDIGAELRTRGPPHHRVAGQCGARQGVISDPRR